VIITRMKPKVIYLCYLPLNQKIESDFYIDALALQGFTVEYWDLTKMFFPNVRFVGEVERSCVRKFSNYNKLKNALLKQDIKNTFFVSMIVFDGKVLKLHRILTQYKCYLIFFARSGLPVFSENESLVVKVINNYRNYLRADRIKNKIWYEIGNLYKQIGLVKNYDLVFAAGSVEESRYQGLSKVIPINHFDFDNCLCVKNNPTRITNTDYCVYLDDNLAYDTDFKLVNVKTVEPISYFSSMRNFFDLIEDNFNLKVVIAAHPKAQYQGNEFGHREILKGKTNDLVMGCRFAIAHYSTSVSYPVIFKKPIIFIYTSDMKPMSYFKAIRNFATVLNQPLFNIDSIRSGDLALKDVDIDKYEEYQLKYLTSLKSGSECSRDIFLKSIETYPH
jgi:hypothetical protein